ncbi:MAG: hypothetical protein ACR2ID_09855 [Chthoniobacterales bacterium]
MVLLFAVFGLFVWAVMGALPHSDNYEAKRAQARADKLKTASDEAHVTLDHYGWVDKDKGVVRVPIERAMELSVAELAQKKPAPAGPAPADTPSGMQATAPVTPAAGSPPQATPTSSPKAVANDGKDSESAGQPAAAANPPGAPPGSQPGPRSSPPPPPSSTTREFRNAHPEATPLPSPPGTPNPEPAKTP